MKSFWFKSSLVLSALALSQNIFSQPISLYCQGRYETGELLQLRLDMDIENKVLITGNDTSPLQVDDFNIVWRSEANGVQFESILNRWTGELSATMIETTDIRPNFLGGLCKRANEIKF
tara:strand:+ start:223 stop:579 length:357 start_codon:yes stop_codon:yes gene_type:complete